MGLTIHYKFKFKGTVGELTNKLEQLRQKCLDLPFAEVGKVERKEITKTAIRVWNGTQYQPDITTETRDKAIAKFGLDAWNIVKAMDYDNHDCPLQPCSLVALSLWPGEGCESSDLGFYKRPRQQYWRCREFCKTQYAAEFVRCHLLVVKMIDLAKKVGLEIVDIHDEGEYYETRDINKLAESINASTAMIESVLGVLNAGLPEGTAIEAPIEKSKNYMKTE